MNCCSSCIIKLQYSCRVFKQRRARYLHESGLAIVYGLGVGVVLRLMGTNREVRNVGENG